MDLIFLHHIIHANSKPNYPEFGIEIRYFNEVMKKLSIIFARLIDQYTFRYQTVFSARLDKQNEDNQILDETELFNNIYIY